MKHLLFLLLATLTLNVMGQQPGPEIELEVSYGLLSGRQLGAISEDVIVEIGTLGLADDKDHYRFSGPAFVTGRYYVSSWLAIGGAIGIDNYKADIISNDGDFLGKQINNSFVIAGEFRIRYLNKGFFQLYSGIHTGYRFINETYEALEQTSIQTDESQFALHLNLLGIRVGKSVGGFLETGFGFKGIMNLGLSVQF